MPLNNLLCGLLETGVNHLHQLDSSAAAKRKQLNGIVIGAQLKEFNFPVYFIISNQQIDILNKFEGSPDCFIRVSSSALNQLQDNHQTTTLIKSGQLEVEGDIQLVQQFAKLLTNMDIDWEEHLSKKVGDILAHKLCYHAKKIQQGTVIQAKKIEKQTALYLTEEIKLAPGGLEVAYFCDQVTRLQQQTNNLQSKLDKLLEKQNAN